MNASHMGLLVGVVAFGLHFVLSILWLRVRVARPAPVLRHIISAIICHTIAVLAFCINDLHFAYWSAFAVFGFLAIAWLFAFSAVYKSVSLRILTQLHTAGEVGLSFATITDDYVEPEFANRIAVLLRMGLVVEHAEGYSISVSGKRFARRWRWVQRICGIARSGLYTPDRVQSEIHLR